MLRFLSLDAVFIYAAVWTVDRLKPERGWAGAETVLDMPVGEFVKFVMMAACLFTGITFSALIVVPWALTLPRRLTMDARVLIRAIVKPALILPAVLGLILLSIGVFYIVVLGELPKNAREYVTYTPDGVPELLLGLNNNELLGIAESFVFCIVYSALYLVAHITIVMLFNDSRLRARYLIQPDRDLSIRAARIVLAVGVGAVFVAVFWHLGVIGPEAWRELLAISSNPATPQEPAAETDFVLGLNRTDFVGLTAFVISLPFGILAMVILFHAFRPAVVGILRWFGRWPLSARRSWKLAAIEVSLLSVVIYTPWIPGFWPILSRIRFG